MGQTSDISIDIYMNVLSFFAMYEIYVHTIFEPSAKKHLPFFSCFIKKEIPSYDKEDKTVFPEAYFVP